MDRSRRVLDHLISELVGDGDVSHLPGAGKPLCLDVNPHTPSDQRAAQKIMQDHNVTPEWITAGKSLAQNETQLLNEIGESAQRYAEELAAAKPSAIRRNSHKRWSRYLANFQERIERHNREVLLYNLKAPKGIAHKQVLDGDALIQRALQSSKQNAGLA